MARLLRPPFERGLKHSARCEELVNPAEYEHQQVGVKAAINLV
jgi:hypothetical protein